MIAKNPPRLEDPWAVLDVKPTQQEDRDIRRQSWLNTLRQKSDPSDCPRTMESFVVDNLDSDEITGFNVQGREQGLMQNALRMASQTGRRRNMFGAQHSHEQTRSYSMVEDVRLQDPSSGAENFTCVFDVVNATSTEEYELNQAESDVVVESDTDDEEAY